MAKARRSTKPPERPSKTDAGRPSRATIEVRPSWLDEGGDGRPTYQRVTTEVDPTWLESESRPPASVKTPGAAPKRKVKPPPLPVAPSDEEDDEPQRSAMPPPLPPTPKKKKA